MKYNLKRIAVLMAFVAAVMLQAAQAPQAKANTSNPGWQINTNLSWTTNPGLGNYVGGNSATITAGQSVYIRDNTSFSTTAGNWPCRGDIDGVGCNNSTVVRWYIDSCPTNGNCIWWNYRDSNPWYFPWWSVLVNAPGNGYTGSNAPYVQISTSASTPGGTYTIHVISEENSVTWGDPIMTPSNQTFTLTVTPAATNGACGSASGKTYQPQVTGYGSDTQCASGSPSSTTFPAMGGTTSWTCSGTGGGSASGTCTANRSAPAQCVNITAPNTVTVGQTFSAAVTMKNTNNITWYNNTEAAYKNQVAWYHPNDPYRLGPWSPADNNRWGLTRVDMPMSSIGTSARYFRIRTPSSTSWVAWREIAVFDSAGNRVTPVNSTGVPDWRGANYAVGPTGVYDVQGWTVWNSGTYSGTITLDYGRVVDFGSLWLLPEQTPNPPSTTHYLEISNDNINWSQIGTIDAQSMRSDNWVIYNSYAKNGNNITYNFTATAPTTPGTYAFDWNMVHEGVEWFPDASACKKNIVVTASAPTCGTDNGKTLGSTPTNLCGVGNSSNLVHNASSPGGWTWQCSNGGAPVSCSANEYCANFINPPASAGTCSNVSSSGYTAVWTPAGGTYSVQKFRAGPNLGDVSSGCGGGTCIAALDLPVGQTSYPSPGSFTGLSSGTTYNNRVVPYCTNPDGSTGENINYKSYVWQCSTYALCTNLTYRPASSGFSLANTGRTGSTLTVSPSQTFYLYADYGAVTDSIVLPGAPSACAWDGWNGTSARFRCTAPSAGGLYTYTSGTANYPPPGGSNICASGPNGAGELTVVAPINGVCGTANGRNYPSTTSVYAPDTQCASGTSTNTAFPAVSGSTSWVCTGANGGSNSPNCSASRQAPACTNLAYVPATSGFSTNPAGPAQASLSLNINSGFYAFVDYGQANIDSIQAPNAVGAPGCSFLGYSGTVARFSCTAAGSAGAYTYRTGTNSGTSSNTCASGPTTMGTVTTTAPINGVCGTANGRNYPSTTSVYAPDTQCASGTSTNTAFPAVSGSTSWVCTGANGGSNSPNCSASRQAPPCTPLAYIPATSGFSTNSAGPAQSSLALTPGATFYSFVDYGVANSDAIQAPNAVGTPACTFQAYVGTVARFVCTSAASTGSYSYRTGTNAGTASNVCASGPTTMGTVTVSPPAPTCPANTPVTLASTSIIRGTTTQASAPAGWSGGSFSSSNTAVATVSGTTVTGVGIGSGSITGSGWTASNGATGCGLTAQAITVTDLPPPGNLGGVNSGAGMSCGQIKVTWTDNSVGEQGFKVYRSTTNNSGTASLVTTITSTSVNSTGAAYSYVDTSPPLQYNVAYYYWVTAYASGVETNKDSAATGSINNTTCEANLNTSDKDIVSVNGVTNSTNTCQNNAEFPANVQFKSGDAVGFSINLCNTAPATGGEPATSIVIDDTLYNLARVDGSKPLTDPAAWNATVDAPLSIASIQVVSGTEPDNLRLRFTLAGSLPAGPGAAKLKFYAKVAFPTNFSGVSSRFQNSAAINYIKDSMGNPGITVSKSTALLMFVKGSGPSKIETSP